MKRLILQITTVLLSACAAMGESIRPPVPNAAQALSLSSFLHQFAASIEDPKVLALGQFFPGDFGHREEPDYELRAEAGCSVNPSYQSIDSLRPMFDTICRNRGGTLVNSFCRDTAQPDRVLFYVRVGSWLPPSCPKSAGFGFTMKSIEPKADRFQSPAYLDALRANGYRTQAETISSDIQQRNTMIADANKAQERDRVEGERIARERPLIRTVGAHVCTDKDGLRWIGYVEQITESKVQIRIVQAGMSRDNQITWDYPEHWRLCE